MLVNCFCLPKGLFADRAVELMKDHVENTPNQPMFLYLPFQNVHVPLQVPKEYEDMYPEIENENRRLVSGEKEIKSEINHKCVVVFI